MLANFCCEEFCIKCIKAKKRKAYIRSSTHIPNLASIKLNVFLIQFGGFSFYAEKLAFKLHLFKHISDKAERRKPEKKERKRAKRRRGKIVLEKEEEIDFFQAVALLIGNNPIRLALKAAPHHKHTQN